MDGAGCASESRRTPREEHADGGYCQAIEAHGVLRVGVEWVVMWRSASEPHGCVRARSDGPLTFEGHWYNHG